MKLLRALLYVALVALPYYANASLADRVVPEQFYDADTEASLGAEQGTHQGTRDAGTSSSNTNFEAIEALLTTLTANITAEREACVTQNAEDTASCQATQAAASAVCQQTFDDAYNPLVETKDSTAATAAAALVDMNAAIAVYDAQFETHLDVDTRRAQALVSLAALTARAADNSDACKAAAGTSYQRAIAYINEAHSTNTAYINAAGAMVDQIETMVAQLQSDSSDVDGTGTQFSAIQKLPMAQRAQLNLLAIKYISSDRTLDASSDLVQLFADLRAAIAAQTASELENFNADTVLAGTQQTDELARCDAEQGRAVDAMTIEKELLEAEELKQRTKLAADLGSKTEKTLLHTNAAATAQVALDDLNTQTPILTQTNIDCKQTSIDEMSTCVGTANGSLSTCTTFLENEESVITSIQGVISDAKTTGLTQLATLAHTKLLQSAGRFVNHLIHRHSNGKIKMPALYTTDLSKHSGIKDEIKQVLDNMKTASTDAIAAENLRRTTLHGENSGLRTDLETKAADKLAQCHADQTKIVFDAQAENDKWSGECTAATDAFDTASTNCDTATTAMTDALQRQIDETPVAQNTLNNSLVAAQNTFNENSALALSKKESSEKYLNEEQGTVNEIRTLLEGLNKPAIELLQDKTLSSEQLQAVVSLLALSGKYNNEERVGYGGSNHSQTLRIKELLTNIEDTINSQLETCCGSSVDSVFSRDSADIAADKASADAAAQAVFAAEELRLQTDVDTTTADKEAKCGLLPALEAEKIADCGAYDAAAAHLTAVTDNAVIVRAQCEATKTAEDEQAADWFNERELNVDTDVNAEVARLEGTIASIDQIETFVDTMTFSAALLQQKNIDNVPTSYRNEDSSDEKTDILSTIARLKETISNEFTRASAEYLADDTTVDNELSSSNLAATQARDTDLVKLQEQVDATNATQVSLTQPLLDASAVHASASAQHNANLDTQQGAVEIQTQNRPVFDQDLAETTTIAEQILGFQKELHNKCALASDYLTITDEYVELIQTAARNVHFDATTTITTGWEVEDKYEGKAAQYIADSHADIKAHFATIVDEESARTRSEGIDESDHSADVADHALSAGMGQHTTYNTAGQTARRLLATGPKGGAAGSAGGSAGAEFTPIDESSDEEVGGDDESLPPTEVAPVEPVEIHSSLGQVIDAVRAKVAAEIERVNGMCSAQQAAFEAQNVDIMAVAQDHFTAQVQEDAARVSAADAAVALSFAALESASAAKDNAQAALDNAAAEFRDAIATQARETVVVEAQFDAQQETNKDNHGLAQARIDAAIATSKNNYAEQRDLLDQVEAAVNSGVNQEELLQALTTAMKHVMKSRLYSFETTKSAHFADNASGEYDHNANVSATFDKHTETLRGMVADLIAQNEAQLALVASSAQQDQVDANTTRDDALQAARTKLDNEIARLQLAQDNAQSAMENAQTALDDQTIVLDAAKIDYTNKEATYQSTLETGNNNIATAQQDRIVCVNNTEATRQAEVARYATSLERAQGLLQTETDMVEQIRAAVNGEEFNAAPAMATWNSCAAEKTAANTAASACAEKTEACEVSRTQNAYNNAALAPACEEQTAACELGVSTKAAFDSCNGATLVQTKLLSTKDLENAFMQLRAKYASATDMGLDFSAHKEEMETILVQIEAKIAAEKTAAELQASTDNESTESKAAVATQGCLDAEQAIQEEWNGKIAVALGDRDAALVTRQAEQASWDGLEGVLATKTQEYNTAVAAFASEGAIAQALFDSEVSAAWSAYNDEKNLIESVAATDSAYLNAENDALGEIQLIVARLGLDHDVSADTLLVACEPKEAALCAEDHSPVCGNNGVKYSNACHADSLCVKYSSDLSGCM